MRGGGGEGGGLLVHAERMYEIFVGLQSVCVSGAHPRRGQMLPSTLVHTGIESSARDV